MLSFNNVIRVNFNIIKVNYQRMVQPSLYSFLKIFHVISSTKASTNNVFALITTYNSVLCQNC